MKHIIKNILYLFALITVAVSVFSCTKEDYECPSEVTLKFSYTYNADDKDYFADEVDKLYMYLFDENNMFISSRIINTSELGGKSEMQVVMPKGTYSLAVWGNAYENEFSMIDGYVLEKQTDSNGEVDHNVNDLFHSIVKEKLNKNEMVIEVPFIKNTNNIAVVITDLRSETRTIPDSDYSIRISGSNGSYNFDNSPVANQQPIQYKPFYSQATVEGKECDRADFKTLRLLVEDDITIDIYEEGRLRRQDKLTDILIKEFNHINGNADLDKYSNFEFLYQINPNGTITLAKIKVEDWIAIPGSGGI